MKTNRALLTHSFIGLVLVPALILAACAAPSPTPSATAHTEPTEAHSPTSAATDKESTPGPHQDIPMSLPVREECRSFDISPDEYKSPDFQNPEEIHSENGVLTVTLNVTYTSPDITKLGNCPVYLRSYNGNLVGPTLRAKPGDLLRIYLNNNLPDNPAIHDMDVNTPHDFNTTNLHTHGLHVSPTGNSDNVLLELEPKSQFMFEIRIPEDHPSGTFWYHPHKHGSTALQVASGMEGALIIEGTGLDLAPEIAAATKDKEQIFVFQQIPYDDTGSIEVTTDTFSDFFGPCTWEEFKWTRTHSINGQMFPTIHMTAGDVHRWRFIHAGIRENISVELRGPGQGPSADTTDINTIINTTSMNPLNEIAVDGLALGRRSIWSNDPVELAPGQRSDVLVQVMTPGTYYLIDGPSDAEALTCPEQNEQPDLMAKVIVTEGMGLAMELPSSESLAKYYPFIDQDIITIDPDPNKAISLGTNPKEVTPVNNFQETSFTVTSHGALNFLAGDHPFSKDRTRQLKLNNTEVWIVTTKDDSGYYAHPFHIHVNPFQTWRIGPEGTRETIWRDTILVPKGENVYLYTTYRDYIGSFVYHCHILDHEDQGMMELLEVVP